MEQANIALRLELQAKNHPEKPALILPKRKRFGALSYQYQKISFKTLYENSLKMAQGLKQLGVKKGDRTLVFVRPGPYLVPLTFALFRMGAVPVFIDPGMGKKNLLNCIEKARPTVLIAEPIVHLIKKLSPKSFSSIRLSIKTKGPYPLQVPGLDDFLKRPLPTSLDSQESVLPEDLAAILFTSGGTGAPKGVLYTHALFNTQTDLLQEMFKLNSQEIDCPGFPLFALFTLSMGMSCVVPDMDASKPSKCHPERLVQNILDHKISFVAGSPAIWERVADYCLKKQITLPSVKYVVMFGAPVSLDIHQKFKKILTHGTTYTPYGATEALPISLIDGQTLLDHYREKMLLGAGTCLGSPVSKAQLKIIPISESIISTFDQTKECPPNTIGEIIVKGPMVTSAYDNLPEATAKAKIYEGEQIWHRMGDIGYLDEQGLLWFCGRLGHRVETTDGLLSSIQSEAIFNQHPKVKRTALVGLGEAPSQRPAIVIETYVKLDKKQKEALVLSLKDDAKKYQHTQMIQDFYFKSKFPVDVRHNIKIDRLKLRQEIMEGELTQ